MGSVYLTGLSYYLPTKKLGNSEISRNHPEWSIDKIALKTGIDNRYIAADDEFVSDMALAASNLFFDEYQFDRQKIDYVILCTQSPDYSLPTTACLIQDRLGLRKDIGAIDINLGCSGYVYGLGMAKGLVATRQATNVLFITADTYSKIINKRDKSNKTLFGDAATATLISNHIHFPDSTFELLDFSYGTDGSGFDNLIVKNSGSRKSSRWSEDVDDENGNYIANDSCLYMDGTKIFNFTSFNVPPMIKKTLEENDLQDADISFYIFHQANAFMLDFIRKRCKIEAEKFFVSMKDVGNTVSSSIPIALKRLSVNNIKSENKILLCGFGVGLSIGGVIIKKV